MKIQLTKRNISELATNGKVFQLGKTYADHHHVEAMTYERNERILRAQIKDHEGQRFRVAFLLRTNGTLQKAACTCEASKKLFGYCEHQIASLLVAHDAELNDFSGLMEAKFKLQSDQSMKGAKRNELEQSQGALSEEKAKLIAKADALAESKLNRSLEGVTAQQRNTENTEGEISQALGTSKKEAHGHASREASPFTPNNAPVFLEEQEEVGLEEALSIKSLFASQNLYLKEDLPLVADYELQLTLHFLPWNSQELTQDPKESKAYRPFLDLAFVKSKKLFPVGDFKKLSQSLRYGLPLKVHQNFTFYPTTQHGDLFSQKVLKWFLEEEFEAHQSEIPQLKSLEAKKTSKGAPVPYLPLSMRALTNLLDIVKEAAEEDESLREKQVEPLKLLGVMPNENKALPLYFKEAFPNCQFHIDKEAQYSLSLHSTRDIYSLGEQSPFCLQNYTLYQLPQDKPTLCQFFKQSLKTAPKPYNLDAYHYSIFLNFLYTDLKNYHLLDDSLLTEKKRNFQSIEELHLPFQAELKLDLTSFGLQLKPSFHYGEYLSIYPSHACFESSPYHLPLEFQRVIHHKAKKSSEKDSYPFVLRDFSKEKNLSLYLTQLGFVSEKTVQSILPEVEAPAKDVSELTDPLYLCNADQIYHFIKMALPILEERYDVQLSEKLEDFKLRSLEAKLSFLEYEEGKDLKLYLHFPAQSISYEKYKQLLSQVHKGLNFLSLAEKGFLDLRSDLSQKQLKYLERLLIFDQQSESVKLKDLLENEQSSDELKQWIEQNLKQKQFKKQDAFQCFYLPHFLLFDLQDYVDEERMTKNEACEKLHQLLKQPELLNEYFKEDLHLSESQDALIRPYQRTGLRWLHMLSHFHFGGILADDMGLGKTLQALLFIQSLVERYQKPVLVVVPTALSYNWLAEAHRFVPQIPCYLIEGGVKERQSFLENFAQKPEPAILISSYGMVRQDIHLFKDILFAGCFLDEAQTIKNTDARVTKRVKQIKALHRFALTGTPIENRLSELWSIFDYLMPGYLSTQNEFKRLYENPLQNKKKNEAIPGYEFPLKRLNQKVHPFILRRLKKDVLDDLPPKMEDIVYCGMEEQQAMLYQNFLQDTYSNLQDVSTIEQRKKARYQIELLAKIIRLRQICCHPLLVQKSYTGHSGKLETLKFLMKEAKSSGHRVLIFSSFSSALKIIKEQLQALDFNCFYLDGQTKAVDRQKLVDRFNAGEGDCFLISLKAGGSGLNLTGADTVIHFDPWWNPAAEHQASDRAHRIGQTKKVQVYKLVTKHSIEEHILLLQEKKKDLFAGVLKQSEVSQDSLSLEQLNTLIQDTLESFQAQNLHFENEEDDLEE